MSASSLAPSPRHRTSRAGWGWLLLAGVSRFYLVLLGSLAACAVLPMLTGMSGAVVQSGSMEPRINAGDVVLSCAIPANAPPPMGRVITFRSPSGSAQHNNVLHRLVAENKNGSLVTAGDANHDPDSTPLARRDILSEARILIPWIGLPSFWVRTGAFLPLMTWVLLTMAALMVGAVDAASLASPSPRPPPGSGPHPENPVEATTQPASEPAWPQRGSVGSLLNRFRNANGPTTVGVIALVATALLATAPFGLASAFSARALSAANSWATAGPATQLVFTTNPSDSTDGTAFPTQPVVAVQAVGGDVVTVSSAPVALSITTPAGATLTCSANPSSAVAGVATFAGCNIDVPGTYTLTAASGGLVSAVSSSFIISAGAAAKLAFTTSPSDSTFGTAFASQPVVAVQNAVGNTVTSSSAQVTLSITPPDGGAVLTCAANPKNAVAGVATFAGCLVDDPGTYTLTATSSGLASSVSSSFTIGAGAGSTLAFTTSPSSSTGGISFPTQPVVVVQDAAGNTVTSSSAPIILSITTSAGATLSCSTNPTSAVSGVATFAGCKVDKKGTYTLTATSGGLTNAVSSSFTITVGTATKLGFTTSPSSGVIGVIFSTQPVVAIQDAGGNTVTTASASVTLAITPPAGTATLVCVANPKTTTSGVATFTGCKISTTAGSYTLTASASGFTSTVSNSFSIAGAATKLAFTTNPSGSTSGTAFPTQPVVTVQDANGYRVTNSVLPITLTITTPAGATLTCTTNPKAAVAGIASFSGCRIAKAGTYTLTATSGAFTGLSTSFTISAGTATKLYFSTSPSNSTSGAAFGTQPVVTVQDASGNTVTTSSAPVTLNITTPAGATLTCTANPANAVAGLASFAGCRVNKTGTYTLTATSSGLTSATSAGFTIQPGVATQLVVTTSPSSPTASGTAFTTQPLVTVQDAAGNTVTTNTASVTLAISPAGAILTCASNPKSASSGLAAFSGCKVDKAGTYTLTATSSLLTSAVSTTFTITAGTATKLAFTTSPTDTAINTVFSSQPVVAVQDAAGNTVTSSTASITLSINSSGGANLTCTANQLSPRTWCTAWPRC